MKVIKKITHTEIKYGIITVTSDLKKFLRDLPERYDIVIGLTTLRERKTLTNKIWVGYETMANFNPGDVIQISKKGSVVTIERYQ